MKNMCLNWFKKMFGKKEVDVKEATPAAAPQEVVVEAKEEPAVEEAPVEVAEETISDETQAEEVK